MLKAFDAMINRSTAHSSSVTPLFEGNTGEKKALPPPVGATGALDPCAPDDAA
jgi:hypothetical protein